VASKIQIFGQNESEWQSALFEAIGQSNMPATYGGELAPLDSKLHPYQSILGPLPSGADGRGLSIGDRMRLYDLPHASPRNKSSLLGLVSPCDASDNSSICSSAFGDALDGGGAGGVVHIPVEYRGWDNEIQYLRSMVNDLNKKNSTSVSYGNRYAYDSHSLRHGSAGGTGGGDDDSEITFEDCLENNEGEEGDEDDVLDPIYEDVRRTLSSSLLYSFYQALRRSRTRLVKFYKMLLPKFLLKLPKDKLSEYLNYSALASIVISVTCIGLSGYALSTVYWTTSNSLVRFQMWSSVVILCLASIYTLLNFAGFVGSKTSNRPLLILFNCSLTVFFLIFLMIAMVCFAFSTNNPSITGIRNEAIHHVDGGNVGTLLRRYNLTLGTVSVVLSLFSLIPLTLSTCYCEVLDRELRADERNKMNRYSLDRRLYEQTQQLSLVVRIAHVVAIIISLPMIGYGASALHYLLKIRFDYSLFAVYCLLYGGITSLLASVVGIWSSFTSSSQLSLLRFYLYFIIPIHILVLFGTGLGNVLLFPNVSQEVNSAYDNQQLSLDYENSNNSKDTVSILLQIQLLVGGVLSLTAGCFQIVCLFCVVSYFLRFQQIQIISKKRWNEKMKTYEMLRRNGKMTEEEYETVMFDHAAAVDPTPLTRQDKIILVWSVMIGLIHIYVGGTFAMFAYRIVESGNNTWMVSIWDHLGKYDSRYVTADGFLISTKGLLALFGGPLFLVSSLPSSSSHTSPGRSMLGQLSHVTISVPSLGSW
jgi:hypothetical protein